jgi:nucleoid DNA-binding protein
MMMNKTELIEQLRDVDEVLLLELLDVTSTELVDAFLDKIEDRINYIYAQLQV